MFCKVKEVHPLPDFRLSVAFCNGAQREYDVKPLFSRWAAFQSLKQVQGLFGQVQVDAGGYGISWNDELDLSCDELWAHSTEGGLS